MFLLTQLLIPITLKAWVIFLFIYALARPNTLSAAAKSVLWQSFFLALFLLPLSLVLPTWQPDIAQHIQPPLSLAIESVKQTIPQSSTVIQNASLQEHTPTPERNFSFLIAIFIWFAGFSYVLVRTLASNIKLAKLISRARDLDSIRIAKYRFVRLLISDEISTPMTTGIFQPVILLPSNFNTKSGQEQRFMIQHEMSHVHRKDMHTMFYVDLITAAHWFNPFVWAARRQLSQQREHACDDSVVSKCRKPEEYAEMLLNIAQQVINHPIKINTVMSMAGRSQLEGRLLAILDKKIKRRPLSRIHAGFIVLLVILFSLPVATLSLNKKELQHTPAKSLAEQIENSLVVESLLSVLNDEDSDVREEAFLALGRIPGSEAVAALKHTLESDNWDTRIRAAHQLSGLGYDALVAKVILPLLKNDQLWTRRNAARALRFNKSEQARNALETAALNDPHPGVREDAVESLGGIGNLQSIIVLEHALADEKIQVSEEAAKALGRIKNPKVHAVLLNALHHKQNRVRIEVIDALGDIQCRDATIPLISLLDDDDKNIRCECIKSLTQIGDANAVDAIIDKLYDSDKHVREIAAESLGKLCNEKAILPLTTLLTDKDSNVREEAADAVGNIYKKLNIIN